MVLSEQSDGSHSGLFLNQFERFVAAAVEHWQGDGFHAGFPTDADLGVLVSWSRGCSPATARSHLPSCPSHLANSHIEAYGKAFVRTLCCVVTGFCTVSMTTCSCVKPESVISVKKKYNLVFYM